MTLVDPSQQLTGGPPLTPPADPFASGPAQMPQAFDLQAIDQKLQKMSTVEQVWGLPQLPHQVKLDLATQHQVDHADLGHFLHGIASDLNQAVNPFAAQPAAAASSAPSSGPGQDTAVPADPFSGDPNSTDNKLHRYWNGIAGLAAPKILTPNAAVDIKTEAVRRGLLPPSQAIDATWGPEMRSVQAQMLNQDFNSRLAGNRPGAISTGTVVKAIGDWMTPSGLLRMAEKLALVPNFHNVAKEASGWGDKWRHLLHHPTPAALADAITGPMDDLLLPIVNDALLFTGVGEAFTFARGLTIGAEAVDAAANGYRTFSALNHLGQAYNVANEVEQFQKGSMLARTLAGGLQGKEDLTAFQRARLGGSGILNAWRDRTDVMIAKKAVQTGGRLGLVSGLEHLIPGYQGGGYTLGDATHATVGRPFNNTVGRQVLGALTPVMDMALAPPTVLGEHAIGDAAEKIRAGLRSTFTDVTHSQFLTAAATKSMFDDLTAKATAVGAPKSVVDLHQRMTELMTQGKLSDALKLYVGGDDEHAGAVLTWLSAHAGLETFAQSQAATRLGGPQEMMGDPGKWRRWTAFYRNKGIAQLAHFADDDLNSYASTRAFWEAENPKERLGLLRKYMGQGLDDEANAFIVQHRANRQVFWNDLMSNVDYGAFRTVLDKAMPTLGNYDVFASTLHDVAVARGDGLLNDAQFAPAMSESGRRLGQWPRSRDLNLSLHVAPPRGPQDLVERNFSPLARMLDPDEGKFTAMLTDHPAKQDALEFAHQADQLLRRRSDLRFFQDTEQGRSIAAKVAPIVAGGAATAGTDLHEIPAAVVSSWLDAADTGTTTPKRLKQYANLMRWASAQGTDVNGLASHLDAGINEMSAHSAWSDLFGVGRDLELPTGEKQLASQTKKLRQAAYWMASAVDTGPKASPEVQQLGARMAQNGYKLVHGVQFITPNDLSELPGVFDEVTSKTVRRLTLGNFIDRQAPAEYVALRSRQLFSNLSAATHEANDRGFQTALGETIPKLSPDSPELNDVIDLLRKEVVSSKNLAEDNVKNGIRVRGVWGRTAARLSNSLQGVPESFADLSDKQILAAISPTYGDKFGGLVIHAVRNSQDVGGFEKRGLLHLEDHLRGQDNVGQLLHVLGRTPIGETFRDKGMAGGITPSLKGALGGAVVGGLLAGGKPQGALLGAAAGATPLGRAATHQAFTMRGVLGGVAGYTAGAAATGGSRQGAQIGAIAGAFLGPSAAAHLVDMHVTPAYETFMANHPTWTGYTHIADHLARLRDQLRFTLNPFFDLRRYVKGSVLAHTAELPDDVALPATVGMRGFIRKYGQAAAGQMRAEFGAASHGDFTPELLDSVGKAFHQEGILGYNPTEYMTALYGHLRMQGVDPEKAAEVAKKVYSYGTTGRSAAELSANFIFFPFSFEKKVLTSGAKFLGSDMSRAAMLHDSLKAYDILNEHYDLSKRWQDHLPLLNQMQKLNAFAHGISPGELGGVNRPLIEFGLNMPPVSTYLHGLQDQGVLNAFIPHGVRIADKQSAGALVDLTKRLLPVRNDMQHLLDDLGSQGHVLFSASHKTADAEVRDGWNQSQELKTSIDTAAKAEGYTHGFYEVMRKPELKPMKDFYESERNRIAKQNPAWIDSLDGAITRKLNVERELQMRTGAISNTMSNGGQITAQDGELMVFTQMVNALKTELKNEGFNLTQNPESVPPAVYETVQQFAAELSQQGHGFQDTYAKYFARDWGALQERI